MNLRTVMAHLAPVSLAFFAIVPVGAAAQQTISLGQATADRGEAFGMIGGVRELSDGSVLVADPLGGALFRLDPTLQSIETLGSEGQGPGEYGQPDAIWPIDGDRSLLVDLGNARLSLVGADGAIGDGWPMVVAGGGGGPMGGMLLAIPRGSDAAGHVYFGGRPMGPEGPRDSVEVYRLDPAAGEPVEVALIKAPRIEVQSLGGGNQSMSLVPLSPVDLWAVAPDGGMFVARAGDGSIEYIGPDGAKARGTGAAGDPVRIGNDEKVEWIDTRAREGGVMVDIALGGDGGRRTTMSRSSGRRREIEAYDWPTHKPPYAEGEVLVDSKGRAWVRRSMPAGEPATYAVFDTAARHVMTVELPPNSSVAAFGDDTVYTTRFDEFDQQFLARHELP